MKYINCFRGNTNSSYLVCRFIRKDSAHEKNDIKETVKRAAENSKLINAYFRYAAYYYNLIPLIQNDRLFLTLREDDFIFDGYRIFRFTDLAKVKTKDDKCDEILEKEGLTKTIIIPEINISSWQTVFESLKKMNRNIIAEHRSINQEDNKFIIGRIEKVYKSFAYVRNFDADGIWDDFPRKIPFTEITNVTFGSRYVDVFSKYIGEPPYSR